MKLIYHDGSVGAIYFPPGKIKDGGSCEFATKKCLKECGLRANYAEIEAYNFFVNRPVGEIVEQILKELFYFSRKILRWFAAGDCPRNLEDKVVEVMKCLHDQGIIQNGFTRNKFLWRKVKDIYEMRLVLTVENVEIAERLSAEGKVAIPDYATGRVKIFSQEEKSYMCGGGFIVCGSHFVDTEEGMEVVISEEDCGICLDKKVGCFS